MLPLVVAAWELGREHKRGRLLGYELIVGFRDLWNVAIGRGLSDSVPLGYRVPAIDKVGVAIALATFVAVMLPLFFITAIPNLRTVGGVFWVVVEGIAMGLATYCYRRAIAYLINEPGRWDFVRNFRMLNPARYEERGRVFVRWQLTFMIFGALWWLIVGPMVLFEH